VNIFLPGRYDLLANKNDDGNTRFLILGDWGGLPFVPYKTPSEVAVAAAMGHVGKTLNTSFQLALGDNFYFDGVQSVTDPRFKVRFIFYQEISFLFYFFFSIHLRMYLRLHHYKHLGMFWLEITII
jgi:hypothetical protein